MVEPAFSEPLRDQILADLNWLRSSPSLLESGLDLDLGGPPLPLDFDPTPVTTFLTGNCSHRVGYYFESLVQILLESDAAIRDVQHGIQIRAKGNTLGEVDFLYQRDGVLHHLEVALKFYLFSPDVELHGSRLLGPNGRDTFERKRDRLLQKQIPLGKKTFPDVEKSHLLVKGAIFYPWQGPSVPPAVEGLSPSHCREVWVRDGQLEEFLAGFSEESRGVILSKPFWITNEIGTKGDCFPLACLFERISKRRAETRRPMLLGVGAMENGRWTQAQRVFVVGDLWPSAP